MDEHYEVGQRFGDLVLIGQQSDGRSWAAHLDGDPPRHVIVTEDDLAHYVPDPRNMTALRAAGYIAERWASANTEQIRRLAVGFGLCGTEQEATGALAQMLVTCADDLFGTVMAMLDPEAKDAVTEAWAALQNAYLAEHAS